MPCWSLRFLSPLCLALAVVSAPALAAEKLFYRYVDANNKVVILDRLPPDVVPRGYDVIRADGSVVKSVAAQLTGAEREAWEREKAVAKARAEAEEKMRAWDESLLLRYSDTADIDHAKARALNDIRVRISILKSNLSALKGKVRKNQSEAAEQERRGRPVPEALAKTLNDLRREVSATESDLERRNAELFEVEEAYERDKARFSQLQENVKRRRAFHSENN
ncbi:hypothetical protein [uncultured Spongiibacter sp.]|uniref:hypothetical protein n=1 Tax=Spongiibacter marinus TaxID=354246 RepID=UPI002593BC2C|nr:hypothetical protein [uncultured Spongiibacter sp.]MBM7424573.1 chromosome segregation ATPase [Spongiibacter marinus]